MRLTEFIFELLAVKSKIKQVISCFYGNLLCLKMVTMIEQCFDTKIRVSTDKQWFI